MAARIEQESDRELSEVARQTDLSQQKVDKEPEEKERRLDNREALLILFTIGLMPSYMMPSPLILISKDCLSNWLWCFVGLICLAGMCNLITLKILCRIGSVKQMDSYQEVAYNISNSNRGYIFLISSAKFIFMAVTVSLNIDYCASYFASMLLIANKKKAAQSYGVYFAGVVLTAIILAIPYWYLRPIVTSHNRAKMALPSYIFAACFCMMTITNISLMLAAVFHSDDISDNNWLMKQVKNNESLPYQSSLDPDKLTDGFGAAFQNVILKLDCSSDQTMIGYIPALFYSNMFSLVFLQIKAKTKISATKTEKDYKMGLAVVLTIFGSAFAFYVTFLIGVLTIDDGAVGMRKNKLLLGVFNAIQTLPSAFSQRTKMTIFDLGYILTFCMMLCQGIVMMQFAREHLLIFVDEHVNQRLSKKLDLKNKGMDTAKKNKARRGEAQNPPGGLSQFRNGPLESEQNQNLLQGQNGVGAGSVGGGDESARNPSGSHLAKNQQLPGQGEQRVNKPINENLHSAYLFACMVGLALANCEPNNIAIHLWVVFASICCPLMDMFIPGIFYFRVMKEEEEEEEDQKCSSPKFKRCMARFYTFLGAILLPSLLTLATKALFSTNSVAHEQPQVSF